MTRAATLTGLMLAGSSLAWTPAMAQSGACLTASEWRTGNNSDEDEQYINLGDNGVSLLEYSGPTSDDGHAPGYTTFAATIEGLVPGARYRLNLFFQRESNGLEREVTLSVAGLQPQSLIRFGHAGRQTLQRNYTANGSLAVIMIHMRGYYKMWSFAGLPRLCPS